MGITNLYFYYWHNCGPISNHVSMDSFECVNYIKCKKKNNIIINKDAKIYNTSKIN